MTKRIIPSEKMGFDVVNKVLEDVYPLSPDGRPTRIFILDRAWPKEFEGLYAKQDSNSKQLHQTYHSGKSSRYSAVRKLGPDLRSFFYRLLVDYRLRGSISRDTVVEAVNAASDDLIIQAGVEQVILNAYYLLRCRKREEHARLCYAVAKETEISGALCNKLVGRADLASQLDVFPMFLGFSESPDIDADIEHVATQLERIYAQSCKARSRAAGKTTDLLRPGDVLAIPLALEKPDEPDLAEPLVADDRISKIVTKLTNDCGVSVVLPGGNVKTPEKPHADQLEDIEPRAWDFTFTFNSGTSTGATIVADGKLAKLGNGSNSHEDEKDYGRMRAIDAVIELQWPGDQPLDREPEQRYSPDVERQAKHLEGTSASSVAAACAIGAVQEVRRHFNYDALKPYEARAHLRQWRVYDRTHEMSRCMPDVFGWLIGTKVFDVVWENQESNLTKADLDTLKFTDDNEKMFVMRDGRPTFFEPYVRGYFAREEIELAQAAKDG